MGEGVGQEQDQCVFYLALDWRWFGARLAQYYEIVEYRKTYRISSLNFNLINLITLRSESIQVKEREQHRRVVTFGVEPTMDDDDDFLQILRSKVWIFYIFS